MAPVTISPATLAVFRTLMEEVKTVTATPMRLAPHANQKAWSHGLDRLFHPTIAEEASLEVMFRASRNAFKFKIHAKFIHQVPCFRFDSDGPKHDNEYDDVDAASRSVPTPHFHTFDNQGRSWAYRPAQLSDPGCLAGVDIQAGLELFCNESRIQHSLSGYPALDLTPPTSDELPLAPPAGDNPHQGVNFP